MAVLSSAETIALKKRLDACDEPWLLAFVSDDLSPEASLPGVLGILDWRLHGQLSKVLRRNEGGGCSLLSSKGKLGKAHLLLYQAQEKNKIESLLKTITHLQIRDLCLAESTFPGDFLENLKHNLRKEGIRWVALESKST